MTSLNYYETLPRKRMASGGLFFNQQGHVLIVKPTYRSYWLLPGGAVETNESPYDACIREIKEELNLSVCLERLLCIDYMPADTEKDECVQFTFLGGVLNPIQIQRIELPSTELSEYRFSALEETIALLSPGLAKRMPHCMQALEEGMLMYLEDGQKVY